MNNSDDDLFYGPVRIQSAFYERIAYLQKFRYQILSVNRVRIGPPKATLRYNLYPIIMAPESIDTIEFDQKTYSVIQLQRGGVSLFEFMRPISSEAIPKVLSEGTETNDIDDFLVTGGLQCLLSDTGAHNTADNSSKRKERYEIQLMREQIANNILSRCYRL